MTLGEAKTKIYMLLDEHSAGGEVSHDEDIELKMRFFLDMAQKELAKTEKIVRTQRISRRSGKSEYRMPENFASLCRVWRDGKPTGKYRWRAGSIIIPESDTAKEIVVEYFAVPETIPEDAPDDYEFEISEEAANAMPYYVAAQQLLPDLVMDYGAMLTRYNLSVNTLIREQPGDAAGIRQSLYR